MSSTTDRRYRTGWWMDRSPRQLVGAGALALALVAIALAAILVIPGLGGSGHARAPNPAASGRHGVSKPVAAAAGRGSRSTGARHDGTVAGHGTGVAAAAHSAGYEPPDPEASKSFPVPASVPHASATSPSAAGELIPAPGAASNAEIENELNEVHAAERATQQRALSVQPGGFSVAGDGTIPIPTDVPEVVQRVIAGGNAIADFPYRYGGGHGSFVDDAYDCSGSVSYALAAGGLVDRTMVSGELARWGDPGPGRWITIYANAGHTFMDVDGIWFDTAGRSGPYASRWLVPQAQPSLSGYAVRHPAGL